MLLLSMKNICRDINKYDNNKYVENNIENTTDAIYIFFIVTYFNKCIAKYLSKKIIVMTQYRGKNITAKRP